MEQSHVIERSAVSCIVFDKMRVGKIRCSAVLCGVVCCAAVGVYGTVSAVMANVRGE